MRKTALALVAGVVLLFWSTPIEAADKAAIDDQIEKALACLDDRSAPDSGRVMVLSLVNAIALAAPETSFGEELGDQTANARKTLATTSIFNPDGVDCLHKSYRLTHSGKNFQMPDSVVEISDAVDYGKKLLAAAREDLKSGKMNESVQKLLEVTVMVLTPKERTQ
jgi:hypothetical protein